MKFKLPLLLALLATAGLVAADNPTKGEGKPGAGKGEGKRPDGPRKPEGVSDEDWKKLGEARKAAQDVKEVKDAKAAFEAAREKAKAAEGDAKEAAMKDAMEAGKALREAEKAAILKADPSLESVLAKVDEAMKARGKGKKKGEGEGEKKKKKGE